MLTGVGGRVGGYSLIELTVTIGVLALILQGFYVWKAGHLAEMAVERTVEAFLLVDEAAYAFHVEAGRWPADLGELRGTSPPLLPPIPPGGYDPLVNGVGGAFVVSVPVPGTLQIETEMLTDAQAAAVHRAYPLRTRTEPGSKVVFTQTAAPKDQTDHQLLVWRDGRHAMTGNLNFDGFQARNVRRLGFRNGEAVGGACTGRDIASDMATGQLLECPLATLRWRPVSGGSDVECLWSGWAATSVISWSQAPRSVVPVRRGVVTVSVAWCDSNGKITAVNVVSCQAASRPYHGHGIAGPSSSCISGLAPP